MSEEMQSLFREFVKWYKEGKPIENEAKMEIIPPNIDDYIPKNYVGAKVRDNIHGIEGICLGVVYHLHDCQWGILQPIGLLEGKPQRQLYVDTQRLDIIEDSGREPKEMRVKPGDTVKDKISGFEGVVTTWTDEFHGSPSVGVTATSLSKDGRTMNEAFPEERMILVKSAEPEVSVNNTASRGASDVVRFGPDND